MRDTFWMFAVMLMLITLTSSLGGGIRYRENFVDEVLDANDDGSADPPQGYDYYPVHHPTEIVGDVEEGADIVRKTVHFEDDLKIDEESFEEEIVEEEEQGKIASPEVPIELPEEPVAVPSNHTSTNEFVVPYGGEFYAPF